MPLEYNKQNKDFYLFSVNNLVIQDNAMHEVFFNQLKTADKLDLELCKQPAMQDLINGAINLVYPQGRGKVVVEGERIGFCKKLKQGQTFTAYLSSDDEKELLTALKAMAPLYEPLKKDYEKLQEKMTDYTKGVLTILKDKDQNKEGRLFDLSKGVASEYSDIPEHIIFNKTKDLVKNIIAQEGREKDVLYTIKEGCKWMLNKLTLGLTPESVSQTIDKAFEKGREEYKVEQIPKIVRKEMLSEYYIDIADPKINVELKNAMEPIIKQKETLHKNMTFYEEVNFNKNKNNQLGKFVENYLEGKSKGKTNHRDRV